jgi:hypothetical protein
MPIKVARDSSRTVAETSRMLSQEITQIIQTKGTTITIRVEIITVIGEAGLLEDVLITVEETRIRTTITIVSNSNRIKNSSSVPNSSNRQNPSLKIRLQMSLSPLQPECPTWGPLSSRLRPSSVPFR